MMKKKKNLKRGFSLVEVVVAIGLVALLLVGVMGLMAPASRDIDRALSKEEAKNMAEALIVEMNTFRSEDVGSNSFEKAKNWMDNSNSAGTAILIYKYNGKLGTVNADGTLETVKRSASQIQGKDYVVNTVARRKTKMKTDGFLAAELANGVVTGKVYLAKFRNYTRGSGGLTLGGYGAIEEWGADESIGVLNGGMLVAQMEIYALRSNSKTYIDKLADLNKLGKPLYTKNVVFRR